MFFIKIRNSFPFFRKDNIFIGENIIFPMAKNKKEDALLLDKITAIIFTMIAILHVWRILYQWQVNIGLVVVPFSWSLIIAILTGGLALSFWKRIHRASA